MSSEDPRSDDANAAALEKGVMDFAQAVNEKRDADAQSIGWKMLLAAGAEALGNPSEDLIWKNLASECEDTGNWTGAEEARKKALDLAVQQENPAFPVMPHLELASLYRILGRHDEAQEHVEAAFQLVKQSKISALLLMVLEAKAACASGHEALNPIREAAAEGLKIVGEGRFFDHTKARFLLVQAECDIALGEVDLARDHLTSAGTYTADWGENAFMAGRQACLARMAELQARFHTARGDWLQAIIALSETLAREKGINAQDHARGLRSRHRYAKTLARFADYLEAGGRGAEAAVARQEWRVVWDGLKLPAAAGDAR